VTTDEPLHVKRLQAFATDGLYVLNSERDATGPTDVPDSAYVYGPATALTMHWLNVRAGNETAIDGEAKTQLPDVASFRVKAFVVRHFAVASLSLLATLAVFGLGWLLLGDWRWGVVAAGVLAAVPAWTGSAMFNMKDSPVGTGYTVMTFALVATVMATRARGRLELLECSLAAVSMVPGIALMVGTRHVAGRVGRCHCSLRDHGRRRRAALAVGGHSRRWPGDVVCRVVAHLSAYLQPSHHHAEEVSQREY
jgi:hypothetical protein